MSKIWRNSAQSARNIETFVVSMLRIMVLGSALTIIAIMAGCSNHDRTLNGLDASKQNAERIKIVEATYGLNCRHFVTPLPTKNTVFVGNVTEKVSKSCERNSSQSSCTYLVYLNVIPDPAPTCIKDFNVEWRCGNQAQGVHLDASSDGAKLLMSCASK